MPDFVRDLLTIALIIGAVCLIPLVVLIVKLVKARRRLGPLPGKGKAAFAGSLLYTFWPIDLLPDPILLDDLFVLASALAYLTKLVKQRQGAGGLVPGSREEAAVKRALKRR